MLGVLVKMGSSRGLPRLLNGQFDFLGDCDQNHRMDLQGVFAAADIRKAG